LNEILYYLFQKLNFTPTFGSLELQELLEFEEPCEDPPDDPPDEPPPAPILK